MISFDRSIFIEDGSFMGGDDLLPGQYVIMGPFMSLCCEGVEEYGGDMCRPFWEWPCTTGGLCRLTNNFLPYDLCRVSIYVTIVFSLMSRGSK